jgi:phosphate transport system ATP-binding protein
MPDPINPILAARDLSVWFGSHRALQRVNLEVLPHSITALIGPSGCGKTTFLRAFNRMNELLEGARTTGEALLDGTNIHHPDVDVVELRRRVGMVFQKSNPFPQSILENVAYGLRLHRRLSRAAIRDTVEEALRQAALWDEVKDRLDDPALQLSGGQQQRLCIARAIAVQPQVLLMDEPASALDPTATARIEELLLQLKSHYTLVIVTHNMQQAVRLSDRTAFFYLGELVETDATARIFSNPSRPETEAYVTGRFG